MKLLLLNHNLREHGTFFRAFHFARELARGGHRITLLTASPEHWYRPVREVTEQVEIIETPSWNPWFSRDDGFGPLDTLYRLGLLARRRWDALFAFAHPPNVLIPFWFWRLTRGGPVAVDWCDLYGGEGGIVANRRADWKRIPGRRPASATARLFQRIAWRIEVRSEAHMARHAPKLTVISRFLQRRALQMGASPSRLLRLPSGAPADLITPLDQADSRRELGLNEAPAHSPLIVYVANYHPDEDFFLDSLAEARRLGARFRLICIGPVFSPGALERRGLRDCVRETGRRPFHEIPRWLGAADLLALPYPDTQFNRSRWPNKIGDYIAAGRPTLTNLTGDFVPLFRRYPIGLASASDPAAYGQTIAEALRRREDWPTWGAAARRLAEGPLHWRRLARRLEHFWLNTTSSPEQRP